MVLASTETLDADGRITYIDPGEYISDEGAPVCRLPYRRFLPHKVMVKLRINVGTYEKLSEFGPEAILFHGTCSWELLCVARYVREHSNVLFYVDSHEDWYNSARGFVSREFLHRRYYGPILRSVLPTIRKILCLSTECIDFVAEIYRIPKKHLEFFPLGGHPIGDEEYMQRREATRRAHGISNGDVLLLQSGRQTRLKKLLDSLRFFAACPDSAFRLFVVGILQEDIRHEAEALIADDARVTYLGWKSPDELTDLLCAADIYLQPGTQSVTMQHSLCCRCAVILDDVPSHKVYLRENGWLINEKHGLPVIFRGIRETDLPTMGANSYAFASDMLDYKQMSLRILQ